MNEQKNTIVEISKKLSNPTNTLSPTPFHFNNAIKKEATRGRIKKTV